MSTQEKGKAQAGHGKPDRNPIQCVNYGGTGFGVELYCGLSLLVRSCPKHNSAWETLEPVETPARYESA